MSDLHNLAVSLEKGEKIADLKERVREIDTQIDDLMNEKQDLEEQIEKIRNAKDFEQDLDRMIDAQIDDERYERHESETDDPVQRAQFDKQK